MTPPGRCVRVALAAPLDRPLTYRLPPGQEPAPGLRVLVPVRGRPTVGFVLGLDEKPPPGVEVKDVLQVLEEKPLFPAEMMPLFSWLAGYYRHPLGQVMATALPSGRTDRPLRPKRRKAGRARPL
ncbi:MAG: primosomal protein N', partial [Deltaproteobacteria bacterium]|nr:primosomal protein N' [Deltaproteobacteria bacterium]